MCQLKPTLSLQKQLTLLLPGAWACRPDLIREIRCGGGDSHPEISSSPSCPLVCPTPTLVAAFQVNIFHVFLTDIPSVASLRLPLSRRRNSDTRLQQLLRLKRRRPVHAVRRQRQRTWLSTPGKCEYFGSAYVACCTYLVDVSLCAFPPPVKPFRCQAAFRVFCCREFSLLSETIAV